MSKPTNFKRKTNRLKDFDYSSPYAYFITICTYDRKEIFNDHEVALEIINQLKGTAKKLNFRIFEYCIMPDHIHLLVGENEGGIHLIKFIQCFKQNTGYNFKKRYGTHLWQKSYYDHILRKEESVVDTARYILNNPVRKGLVSKFREYPFLGSMVFHIDEL